jgi:hypothetical protein
LNILIDDGGVLLVTRVTSYTDLNHAVVALSHGKSVGSKPNRNLKYSESGEQISPGLPGIFYLRNGHSISGQVVKKTLICSRKIFHIIEMEKSKHQAQLSVFER